MVHSLTRTQTITHTHTQTYKDDPYDATHPHIRITTREYTTYIAHMIRIISIICVGRNNKRDCFVYLHFGFWFCSREIYPMTFY